MDETPAVSEICKGLVLFSTSIGLFAVYACVIKIIMYEWHLSIPELTYYVSLLMFILFAISAGAFQQDMFCIPKGAQLDLFFRAICGFGSDICLFVAF